MYTRCPQCQTPYPVGADHLRNGQGEVICGVCHTVFNALRALADSPEQAHTDPYAIARIPTLALNGDALAPPVSAAPALVAPSAETAPPLDNISLQSLHAEPANRPSGVDSDAAPRPARHPAFAEDFINRIVPLWSAFTASITPVWSLACIGAVLLLGVQTIVFAWPQWAQNLHYRPWLEKTCKVLHCSVPEFRDLQHIEIVERALTPARGGIDGLDLRAVIVNYAGRPQRYPDLRLTLTQFDGDPIAQRLFKPSEYLTYASSDLMVVGIPAEARLLIANPGKTVGGFRIELL